MAMAHLIWCHFGALGNHQTGGIIDVCAVDTCSISMPVTAVLGCDGRANTPWKVGLRGADSRDSKRINCVWICVSTLLALFLFFQASCVGRLCVIFAHPLPLDAVSVRVFDYHVCPPTMMYYQTAGGQGPQRRPSPHCWRNLPAHAAACCISIDGDAIIITIITVVQTLRCTVSLSILALLYIQQL